MFDSLFNPIVEFFSGAAFRPHIQTESVPLARRMAGKRFIVGSGFLGISQGQGPASTMVKVGVAEFPRPWKPGNLPQITDVEQMDWKTNDAQMAGLKDLYSRHGTNSVAWLLPDFLCNLSASIPAMDDVELNKACRENPKPIIGKAKEPARAYAAIRHPRLQSGIIFNVAKPRLISIRDAIAASEGRMVRLQSGVPSMLRCLMDTAYDRVFTEPVSRDVYMLDHLSMSFHLFTDSKDWTKVPLARQELCTALDPIGGIKSNIIRQMRERRNVPLIVINTTHHQIRSLFQDPDLKDIKVEFFGEPEKGLPYFDFVSLCHL